MNGAFVKWLVNGPPGVPGVASEHVARERRRRQVHVVLLQAGVGVAGLVDLRACAPASALREAVHALPAAVQVVEAVVLLVDDDDVLDLLELLRVRARR